MLPPATNAPAPDDTSVLASNAHRAERDRSLVQRAAAYPATPMARQAHAITLGRSWRTKPLFHVTYQNAPSIKMRSHASLPSPASARRVPSHQMTMDNTATLTPRNAPISVLLPYVDIASA